MADAGGKRLDGIRGKEPGLAAVEDSPESDDIKVTLAMTAHDATTRQSASGGDAVQRGMNDPTDEQMTKIGAALDDFTRRHKLADPSGAERPLNELDKQVLLFTGDNPGCGPSDVARFLAVANTTISSATDRLVKRGLLDRDRIEKDRRAISLRLSKSGEETAMALRQLHQDLYRMMLRRLSPDEREQFVKIITKIAYYED